MWEDQPTNNINNPPLQYQWLDTLSREATVICFHFLFASYLNGGQTSHGMLRLTRLCIVTNQAKSKLEKRFKVLIPKK